MDDDTDISLSLNLTTFAGSGEQRRREKIRGNRRDRIKQRRQLKSQRQISTQLTENTASGTSGKKRSTSDDDDEYDNDDSASPAKRKRQKTDGHPRGSKMGGLHRTDKAVTSSLFRHNPDIPTVKSASVTGVKEEVFASTKFSDLPLFPHLVSNLEQRMGLTTMTRVQQLSIPVILKNTDTLVKSQTGSGKTLAYAVPIVHSLATRATRTSRTDGPYALVVVPTRELAVQSFNTFSSLLQSAVWIVAGSLMGGEKRKAEKARLRKGINILVTTPGRLLDHLQHTGSLSLSRVQWLVLDEADRLLDMGYEKDVSQIVTALNTQGAEQHQTILLSATLTAGVERLAGIALKNHTLVDASSVGGNDSVTVKTDEGQMLGDGGQTQADGGRTEEVEFTLPEKLRQHFVLVPCKLRLVTLTAFVLWKCKLQGQRSKMVVFLSTKDSVEFHHTLFSLTFTPTPGTPGYRDNSDEEEVEVGDSDGEGEGAGESLQVFKLHGDMPQKERTRVFQDFKTARCGVLLCTDVAARGLHLPRVDWIVQYSTPGATVDYIHRVGRTARAGKHGNALLFLMPSEAGYVKELNKHKISLRELPMQDILGRLLSAIHELPAPQTDSKRQAPRTFEEAATYLQDRFEERVVRDRNLQTLAAKGYQSFVRAYATYPPRLKEIFSMKELHLGHAAKSFALREAPSHLHNAASRPVFKGQRSEGKARFKAAGEKKSWEVKYGMKKGSFSAGVSEFGSGFDASLIKHNVSRKPKGKGMRKKHGT